MHDAPAVVLGIDPGSRVTGYGLVVASGRQQSPLAWGVIRSGEDLPLAERLARLHAGLSEIIARHRPTTAAVEEIFHAHSARSALVLGQARGVALLACAQAGLAVEAYPPARVKSAVSGYGQADKRQVALSIRLLLGLTELPPADAADALAIALTHARARHLSQLAGARVLSVVGAPARRRARRSP